MNRNDAVGAKVPERQPLHLMAGLQVQSATQVVYQTLLKAILSGELEAGRFLQQAQLAEQLGVSRTPLREALMQLASVGLVEIEPNRGAKVTGLDFGNMRHAWMARVFVESGAAREAARSHDTAAVERMQQAIRRQYEVTHDLNESLLLNRAFHLALVAASGNPYLIRFSEMLWAFDIAVPIFGPQATNPSELSAWADDHQRIVDAILAGDADLAEATTRAHILSSPPHSPKENE